MNEGYAFEHVDSIAAEPTSQRWNGHAEIGPQMFSYEHRSSKKCSEPLPVFQFLICIYRRESAALFCSCKRRPYHYAGNGKV
jgi:hypothetical protein